MLRIYIFFALAIKSAITLAASGPNWTSGNIKNMTSLESGVLIIMDSPLPTNCTGTPYGWLFLNQTNKTMTAVLLSSWYTGSLSASVYTKGITSSGYCEIDQFDPQ